MTDYRSGYEKCSGYSRTVNPWRFGQEPLDDGYVFFVEDSTAISASPSCARIDVLLDVFLSGSVPKIIGSIVPAVPVEVQNFCEIWARPNKGFSHKAMY